MIKTTNDLTNNHMNTYRHAAFWRLRNWWRFKLVLFNGLNDIPHYII